MPRVGQTLMPRVGQAPLRCSLAVVPTYMYLDVPLSGRVVFYSRYSSFVTRTAMLEDYRLFVQLVRDPYTTIVEDYRLFFLRNPFPTPGIIPVKLQVFYPDVRSAVLKGLRTSICYIPPTPTADFCTVVSYW